jgi:hypothetical protein
MKRSSWRVLIGRTLQSMLKHRLVYGACIIVLFALELLATYARPSTISSAIAPFVLAPIFATIVYAYTLGDVDATLHGRGLWLRVLERAWAVIVIDDAIGIAAQNTIVPASLDLTSEIVAVLMLFLMALLTFADVHAVADPNAEPWWMLVPRAVRGSVAATLMLGVLSRAMLLVAAGLLVSAAAAAAVAGLGALHVAHAVFWGNELLLLLAPPLNALTAFVYLDAVGYEARPSPDA